jgi:hypothetical protein
MFTLIQKENKRFETPTRERERGREEDRREE